MVTKLQAIIIMQCDNYIRQLERALASSDNELASKVDKVELKRSMNKKHENSLKENKNLKDRSGREEDQPAKRKHVSGGQRVENVSLCLIFTRH